MIKVTGQHSRECFEMNQMYGYDAYRNIALSCYQVNGDTYTKLLNVNMLYVILLYLSLDQHLLGKESETGLLKK